ncbi:hypothetical protein P879_04435 [Paragonimus westermani]|uniref:EF-hand domain-containing protein n=1 Tax=Paragonimus westermani TaxID=34504 RepID=A0A8T0DG13_9TREM|nr:hypothetical protein P879_04435 [Paragonimus westermani]
MEAAFGLVDKNKSGTIEKQELFAALQAIGEETDRKELDEMFRLIQNPRYAGKISFQDFCKFMQTYNGELRKKKMIRLRETFQQMDKSHNGKLEVGELRNALTMSGLQLDKEAIEEIITSIDVDAEHYINYEDFIRLLMK